LNEITNAAATITAPSLGLRARFMCASNPDVRRMGEA